MSSLDTLLDDPKRSAVVADLADLANTAVQEQSGITGAAVKAALGTARKVDEDIVAKAVDKLLPTLVETLAPHFDAHQAKGGADFGAALEPKAEQVAEELLERTDAVVEANSKAGLDKVYKGLRGKGVKLITPHVPALGTIIAKHA